MDYWRIVALVRIATFSVSAFIPLVSSLISLSLIDFYGLEIGIQKPPFGTWTMPNDLAMVFVTMFLYPITLILGFLTLLRRRLALAAGSVGIVCWLSAFLAVSNWKLNYSPQEFSMLIQYGAGIFFGLVGGVIILISFFLKPEKWGFTPVHPPLPNRFCTFCGAELNDQDAFCRKCGKAVLSRATTKTKMGIETNTQSRILPRSTERSLSPRTKGKPYCTFCHAMLGEDDVFCRKCGKVVPS